MPIIGRDPSGFRPSLPVLGSCLRQFVGTTPSSDFLTACMAVVRREPSPPVPGRLPGSGTVGISRFSRVKLLGMLRVCDTASASDDLR